VKRTLLLAAVLCLLAVAAAGEARSENREAGAQSAAAADRQSMVHSPSSIVDAAEAITIPQMLSYQGKLTDTAGVPVPNGNYSVVFKLYTVPSGGSPFWNETQNVATKAGLFSVLLGSVMPIGSVPDAGALYLGMAVAGGTELTPRLRIASAAYAYKADTANYALAAAGGGDNAWVRGTPDSVLYTVHKLGIARGESDNALHGTFRQSHVNFGVACTTGVSGQNYSYLTIGGGYGNRVRAGNTTVGGGTLNAASGVASVVAGGAGNVAGDAATDTAATVAGGFGNLATASYAAVGGGQLNQASGRWASVPGGRANTAGDAAADTGAVVAGGIGNTVGWKFSAIGGGEGNTITGHHSTICGGYRNSIAHNGGVAAGFYNVVNNIAGVALGYADTVDGMYGFAANSWSQASYASSAAFNGQATTATSQTRVGVLSKASGTFTIDHPLDPHGKILNHYFIEGPEMRNIYDGEAVLDASGRAVVRLPDYFEALNRRPRVQLTGIGSSDVYLAEKVTGNWFVIGGRPGTEVYWQVTGERKDVSAEATRRMMPVEQPKTGPLAGRMLDDDFLTGCMDQLVSEGKAQGIDFRTAAGRAKYDKMRQHLREVEAK